MSVEKFGEALLRTLDLDPVYVAAHSLLKTDDKKRRRWLLAYWCFYHVGVACYAAEREGAEYWRTVMTAARNVDGAWPRGTERRHFRGDKCVRAIEHFARREPEYWVGTLLKYACDTDLMNEVKSWPLCGPWLAFKAADMMERVAMHRVQFDQNIGLFYEEPRRSLELLSQERRTSLEKLYAHYLDHFSRTSAPPAMDRGCGPQEVETILCKHKAARKTYWVGKDIREVRHALSPRWGADALKFLEFSPKEVDAT